jgi:tryptophanyl-tRNA synthetase
VGQFDYPPLMAADILLYGALYVPVGDDQRQHIEYTRDIAERLNKRFGELFVVPKPMKEQHEFFGKDQGLRVKDLADPAKKMSKSDETGKGVIFMTDSPDEARQKIMAATTDSEGKITYDKDKQPGVGNLLDILALISGHDLGGVRQEYEGQTQYGPLKVAVGDAVAEFLTKFQHELAGVNDQAILDKLATSEKQMNEQANATLLRVQKAVGLRA